MVKKLFSLILWNGSDGEALASGSNRVPLLLSAHGFCYLHFIYAQGMIPSRIPIQCIIGFQDDRYFISGSLDGKIRLWHIPEKKVALWNEVEQVKFITAITFVRNGKFVVVGTYNGRCFFYTTDVSEKSIAECKFENITFSESFFFL